jgi:hypothetical protein
VDDALDLLYISGAARDSLADVLHFLLFEVIGGEAELSIHPSNECASRSSNARVQSDIGRRGN